MSNPLPMGGQEFDKRTPPTPPNAGDHKSAGKCLLSYVLIVTGIASIIAGFVCDDELLYMAGGILTGIYNFALAVIVDACDKYIRTYKG